MAQKKAGEKSRPTTIVFIVLGIIAAVIVGWNLMRPADSGTAGIRNVDTAGAQKAIAAGARIIDVRTAGEYQMGHIPGAENVPVDQIATAAEGWDRNADYVVYCAVGSRSASAVQTMQSMGFKNIAHLNQGIQSWTGGDLQTGSEQGTAGTRIETAGKPVLVEFYTDT